MTNGKFVFREKDKQLKVTKNTIKQITKNYTLRLLYFGGRRSEDLCGAKTK